MFARHDEADYQEVAPGIRRKTLCFGGNTLMSEFRLLQGHILPRHSHPQEQTGYLISGHLALTIDGETHDVVPCDSWCLLGGAEHGAEVLQDSVAVEVFSPVREDYVSDRVDADRHIRGDDETQLSTA